MDGTLVDTEPYWMAAEIELVEAHGGIWTHDDALALVGTALDPAAVRLQEAGVDLPAERITGFLLARVRSEVLVRVPWQKGALSLLREVARAGIPSALVTSSYRTLADAVVAGAPDGTFQTVVCGDDVTRGKPHPEAYLMAAERLGVDITRCVALEDSPAGIGSALASGARTIAVQVMVPVPPRPALTRVASLAMVDLPLLTRVADGEVLDLLDA
jgi:HAD superfamily hydrolase (TIGR01509 family)